MTQPNVSTITYTPSPEGHHPAEFAHHSQSGQGRCPYAKLPLGSEVRIVTERADVIKVLTDDANFGVSGVTEAHAATGAPLQGRSGLLRMDRPDSTRVRRIMGGEVSGNAVEKYLPEVERIADTIAADLRRMPGRPLNLAMIYNSRFIANAAVATAGIQINEWRTISRLSSATLGLVSGAIALDNAARRWPDLYDYTKNITAAKRAAPDGSMISNLVSAFDKAGITGDEQTEAIASFINGLTTPVDVMTVCIAELLQRPKLVRACLKEPAKWEATINEILRYKAHFSFAVPRIAKQDTMLGDQKIRAGEVVMPSLTGALHDPAHAEKPYEVDPDQQAKRGLVFGAGAHYCPAAELGRQWLTIGIRALFTQYPNLRLAIPKEKLAWLPGSLPTPVSLPVRLDRPFSGILRLFGVR